MRDSKTKTKLFMLSAILWLSIASIAWGSWVTYPNNVQQFPVGTPFWNVIGSTPDTYRARQHSYNPNQWYTYGSWSLLWLYAVDLSIGGGVLIGANGQAVPVYCAGCHNQATVGGHVVFNQAHAATPYTDGHPVYILPLCAACNHHNNVGVMYIQANAPNTGSDRAVLLNRYCVNADGNHLGCP